VYTSRSLLRVYNFQGYSFNDHLRLQRMSFFFPE
jgi:hypothetical protein